MIKSDWLLYVRLTADWLLYISPVSPEQGWSLRPDSGSNHQEHELPDIPGDSRPGYSPAGGRQRGYTGT